MIEWIRKLYYRWRYSPVQLEEMRKSSRRELIKAYDDLKEAYSYEPETRQQMEIFRGLDQNFQEIRDEENKS